MNNNAEPFDPALLEKLYAAIPAKGSSLVSME